MGCQPRVLKDYHSSKAWLNFVWPPYLKMGWCVGQIRLVESAMNACSYKLKFHCTVQQINTHELIVYGMDLKQVKNTYRFE